MVVHGGSSAGSYLANPTSSIPSHCASIVVTNTVRVNLIAHSIKGHSCFCTRKQSKVKYSWQHCHEVMHQKVNDLFALLTSPSSSCASKVAIVSPRTCVYRMSMVRSSLIKTGAFRLRFTLRVTSATSNFAGKPLSKARTRIWTQVKFMHDW